MTRAEFRDALVKAYGKASGVSHIPLNDTVALNALIQRGLEDFTRWTYSIYNFKGRNFTLIINEPRYNVAPIFRPDVIFVDNLPLRHPFTGKFQLVSRDDFFSLYPSYLSDAPGRPSVAMMEIENTLFLHPTPDATYEMYVIGYEQHPVLNADNDVLSIPDRVCDLAAMWIASLLQFPHASGDDTFGKIFARDKFAGVRLQEYKRENLHQNDGVKIRGRRSRIIHI